MRYGPLVAALALLAAQGGTAARAGRAPITLVSREGRGAAKRPAGLSREREVIVATAPVRTRRRRALAKGDPVPGLGKGDAELFKGGLTQTEVKKLLDGYLDRMLSLYSGKHGFAPGLVKLLAGDRLVKEVFVSALDPRYDDIAKAAEVFESLRAADEKKLVKYVHLATALAVVFDTPDAVATSRYSYLWSVDGKQFKPLPTASENWDYYTDRRLTPRFGFALHRLPWSILVHLVDNDVPQDERRWAHSKYGARGDTAALYRQVPYDHPKAERKATRLGEKPYTLSNVLKHGGVCVDQAHFASRVAKCLGIPATKVTGHGRYGGAGHAWTGYLVIERGRPLLKFTGRFFFDYYYTGRVFDPQTRTFTLDRYVAMMYDGASLSYPKYNRSRMLVRMAEKLAGERPAESLKLVQEGLRQNYFNMWGWPLLVEHVRSGTLSRADGLKWFNKMLLALRDHPDMTYACLGTFLECMPADDVRQRQSLYNQAAALYKARPDLLLKLRKTQTDELASAGKKREALVLLIPTVTENAKEAKLVLPAMRAAVALAKELGLGPVAYRELKKADRTFPKKRGTTPSEAYAEFVKLLGELK